MSDLAKYMQDGGLFMYFIAGCSVWGLALIVERVVSLVFRYNINSTAFMAQIQKLVMSNNIDRAVKLCNAAPSSALAKVLKAGLARANRPDTDVANAMQETTLEIVPVIQKRTPALQACANISTLLGLLGTIQGLIMAFDALEFASPEQRGKALAKGIAIAMYTTFAGLSVAIPCLFAHLLLSNVTKKILDDIDQYSAKLQNLLAARRKPGPTPSQTEG